MNKWVILTISWAAAIGLAQHRFVGFSGGYPTGTKALGVTAEEAVAGETIAVDVVGITIVEAGGVIALGAEVESDAEGRAITLALGVGNGWALDAAGAAGDLIRVKLA